MLTFDDEEFAQMLEEKAGQRPDWSAQAFGDVEEDLRRSMQKIHESPFLPQKSVRGFVFEVETGRLREVVD